MSDQLLVNAQVDINRAVWKMNQKWDKRNHVDRKYIMECVDSAIETLKQYKNKNRHIPDGCNKKNKKIMAKKDLKKLAEPLLNSALKNATYAELKKYALELEVDLKSLKKMNENNLRKGIKEKLASKPIAVEKAVVKTKVGSSPAAKVAVQKLRGTTGLESKNSPAKSAPKPTVVPFNELENQSLTFKINYAFHHGVPKETIMEKLNITAKRYVDVTWLYANAGYKQKIESFLAPKN